MVSFNITQPTEFGNYMLKDFNEIIFPDTISFVPDTFGAWLAVSLFAVVLITLVAWLVYRWHKNAYRREAMIILSGESIDDSVALVPSSLRKVASQAYPNLLVGSLVGEEWFRFLNTSAKTPLFPVSLQMHLQAVTFQPPLVWEHKKELNALLVEAALEWIAHHQPLKELTP